MEIYVHRDPSGYLTSDMEHVAQLQEYLEGLATAKPLDDKAEVHLEITGTWGEIRELLSQPCFRDNWQHAEGATGVWKYDAEEHRVTCLLCGWWHRALTGQAAERLAGDHFDGSSPDIPKCRHVQ